MASPTCATSCASALPAVSFDACTPETHLSEISRIFIGKATSAAFATWGEATEWTTRVSETSTTGDDYLRPIIVIGDKPAPTGSTKDLSNGRQITIRKTHTLNFTIDETNEANHEFLRSLECGGVFKIWYETADGLLFGGNSGITANVTLDMVLNRGQEEMMTFNGVFTWKTKYTEERTDSPIFGVVYGGTVGGGGSGS